MCGIQPDQFWSLTPYAFAIIIKSYSKKLANEFDAIRYQTWHTAAFMRIKRMPDFKSYIKPLKTEDKEGINEAEIKAVLKAHQNGQSRKS